MYKFDYKVPYIYVQIKNYNQTVVSTPLFNSDITNYDIVNSDVSIVIYFHKISHFLIRKLSVTEYITYIQDIKCLK